MAAKKKSVCEHNSDSDSEISSDFTSSESDEEWATDVESVCDEYFGSDDESESEVGNEESQVDLDEVEFDVWTSRGEERPAFPFNDNSGTQFSVSDTESILEYLNLFLDDDFFQLISDQSNLYAKQFLNKTPIKEKSRCKEWTESTPDEVRCLLGLLILQGVVHKPENAVYFSKTESIETPFFRKIMSERRFHLLLKFLHFTDNEITSDDLSDKKLFKIRPILEYVRNKFKSLYIPEKSISIDESILLWKGRLSWKRYIPTKRSRFGMKIFKLCESGSGYIWNFLVYTGKGTKFSGKYSNQPIATQVVFDALDNLIGKRYQLYIDNWYTSVELVDMLNGVKTDVVGTLRQNRKGSSASVTTARLTSGNTVCAYKKKVMIMKWKDKRDVLILSTTHDDKMGEIRKRNVMLQKPQVILDYNKNMGAIDQSDAQLQLYKMSRERLKKNYQKMFRYLLDMTCLNMYILYKKNGGRLSRLKFLIKLGETLSMTRGMKRKLVGRPSGIAKPSRLLGYHFPDLIPGKGDTRRRCVMCSKNKKRQSTKYYCKDCDVGLCFTPCFRLFHTQRNL